VAEKWMTANEAAEYLRIEPRTVLAWARAGKIKAYALSGTKRKIRRFLLADLDSIMLPRPSVLQ